MYKLIEPQRNKQSIEYWVFVACISTFMIWLLLVDPIVTGNWKSWGMFSSGLNYGLWTGSAIFAGILAIVPVVVNDSKHDYTLSLIYSNRDYITHLEYMALIDKLTYHVWKKGNAKEVQKELYRLVQSHAGLDLRVEQYHLKKEYAKNLVWVG